MTTRTEKGQETAKKIRQAFIRIKNGRTKNVSKSRKVSVAAVAEEAGVTRTSIHKDYPELCDQIKAEAGKDIRVQRDKKHEDLKSEKLKNKELREELTKERTANQKLISINASLMLEVKELRAIIESENVALLLPKKN